MGEGPALTRALAAAAIAVLGLIAVPPLAGAATIGIDTFADVSADGDDLCSLREAVTAANTNANTHEDVCVAGSAAQTDFIDLDNGTYELSGSGDDTNVTGDLDLIGGGPVMFEGAIDFNGHIPGATIDANGNDRILDVQPSGTVSGLELQFMILTDGAVAGTDDGGAIRVGDPDTKLTIDRSWLLDNDAGGNGGAIVFDDGAAGAGLNVTQTEFAGNNADAEGGALYLDLPDDPDFGEDPTIERSTLAANKAEMGGAVYLETRASDGVQLFLTNSTLSGNEAADGGSALAFDQLEGGNAYFAFSTIAENRTTGAGGGAIYTTDGGPNGQFVLFSRSIVADNTAAGAASNCVGPGDIQSSGYNLESANSCGFSTGSPQFDLVNTDALLAPLATNAGVHRTTRTHGPYDESPAVNRIPRTPSDRCFEADEVDQRGEPRPAAPGGLCDVGAFEGTVGPAPSEPPPTVKCAGRKATTLGTKGKDVIVGTKKADVIAGLGGNDTIKGKGRGDLLCGGAGKDRLIGGRGRDKLFGQAGRDILRGGPGRDKLKGGPGRDRQIQ